MDAEVRFRPSGNALRVEQGTTVLGAARRAGLPMASACGAHGVCGRCGVTVVSGAARLSPETEREVRVKEMNRVAPSQRLACCAEVSGDVEVSASYW